MTEGMSSCPVEGCGWEAVDLPYFSDQPLFQIGMIVGHLHTAHDDIDIGRALVASARAVVDELKADQ